MEKTTNSYTCPSCSSPVDFKNATNNVACCTNKHTWQRKDGELLSLEIPVIQQSADMIQPGTTGSWNDLPFTVTGRFRLWFDDIAFNYWTIDMGNRKIRYLAEGYGMFAIYETKTFSQPVTAGDYTRFEGSQQFTLPDNNQHYEITDRNLSGYLDIEGAFYKPDFEKKIKSIDALSKSYIIEIFQFDEKLVEVFDVHPVSFEDLNLQNLRETASEGKTFSCRKCAARTTVKTFPYAQSWVCYNCQTRHSVMDSQLVREHGINKSAAPEMHLAIGSSITLKETSYEVIGFAQKQDKDSKSDKWKEYTLHNDKLGYAFLNESDGHWMLLKETMEAPLPSFASFGYFSFRDKTFSRFLNYNYTINYAAGEFPGNIFKDLGVTETTDFVSPPEILSVEQNPEGRTTWFSGEYIHRNIIKQQVTGNIPHTFGVAPAQPVNAADTLTIVKAAVIAIFMVLVVQYFNDMTHLKKTVLNQSYELPDSVATKTFVTERFELNKWKSNLELNLYAPVYNSWFELNATLVNVNDGTEYSLEQGLEFYQGHTGGESWAEGSNRENTFFTSIPAGTYFLQITGIRDQNAGFGSPFVFGVKVINDTPMYRNLWLTLLAIVCWPVIMCITNYFNERQRWSNSPYSNFDDE